MPKEKNLPGKIIVKKKRHAHKSIRPHALCRHSSYYSEQKATESSRNLARDEADRSDRVDWPKKIAPDALQQLICIKASPLTYRTTPLKCLNALTSHLRNIRDTASSYVLQHLTHIHSAIRTDPRSTISMFLAAIGVTSAESRPVVKSLHKNHMSAAAGQIEEGFTALM